jgi:hypothetical protein
MGALEKSYGEDPPDSDEMSSDVQAWLAAIVQSEHLGLLLGNGFTRAVAGLAGDAGPSMSRGEWQSELGRTVQRGALETAQRMGRGNPNLEDELRVALALESALGLLEDTRVNALQEDIEGVMGNLVSQVLQAEQRIEKATRENPDIASKLVSFLLTFAARPASRGRLNLFSVNYDRIAEYGCDLAGLRPLDRFVGSLEPIFRASRLDVDMHYNPPGIRGEPRYLEGVVRMVKPHGSLDWRWRDHQLRRVALPFGAEATHPEVARTLRDSLMIYPSASKDVETLLYPYAELFRDFSAATCRPNSALVTYGYGFGDDHLNRIIIDMLTIPSTHLVVFAYDWCDGRLESFLRRVGHEGQVTLLVGNHFSDLTTLVDEYLPHPAFETVAARARRPVANDARSDAQAE